MTSANELTNGFAGKILEYVFVCSDVVCRHAGQIVAEDGTPSGSVWRRYQYVLIVGFNIDS